MSEELNTEGTETVDETMGVQAPDGMDDPMEEAVIDQIVAEAEADGMRAGGEEPEPTEKKEAAPKSEPKTPKAEKKPEKTEESEGKQELVSTQLAKLHRYKNKIEKSLAKKEAELDAKIKGLETTDTKTVAELKALARTNPVKFFQEELGIERTSDVGRMLYAPELGDQAPEDLKRLSDKWETQQELKSVRQEFAEFKAVAEKAQAEDRDRQLMSNSRSYIKSYLGELQDTAPYLERLAKARPDQATDALLETAVRYAQDNPDSEPLTVEELVENYETSLAEELSFLELSLEEKKTEKPAPKKKASKTLSNRLTSPTDANTTPMTEEETVQDILSAIREERFE